MIPGYDQDFGERKRGRPCIGNPKSIKCNFKISLDEYDKIETLSNYLEVSNSEVIRRALKMYYASVFYS